MLGAKTGEQSRELQGHSGWVRASVSFSGDGNKIVSGSGDKSVRVWANLNLGHPSWIMKENGWILTWSKNYSNANSKRAQDSSGSAKMLSSVFYIFGHPGSHNNLDD